MRSSGLSFELHPSSTKVVTTTVLTVLRKVTCNRGRTPRCACLCVFVRVCVCVCVCVCVY